MDRFVLVDGYVSVDNVKLHIDINNTKRDLKQRGGWLGVILTLLCISIFRSLEKDTFFKSYFEYINIGFQILGVIGIIAIFIYLFRYRKSKKSLIINEITTIEVHESEFETQVTLIFNNKREFQLDFRTLEHQVRPFITLLQKRNSRLQITTI